MPGMSRRTAPGNGWCLWRGVPRFNLYSADRTACRKGASRPRSPSACVVGQLPLRRGFVLAVPGDPRGRVPLHPALRLLFRGEREVGALGARPIDGDPAPALPQGSEREVNFVVLHEIPRMILLQGPYRARARVGSL